MKPVRTFHLLVSAVLVTASLVGEVTAQQSSVRQRSSERTARASWRPTRTQVVSPSRQQPADQSRNKSNRVLLVDHHQDAAQHAEVIPTPTAEPQSVIHTMPGPPIMDGQIMVSPAFDGSCDALPGDCGCGDALCIGDCGTCSSGDCGLGGCSTCGELCSDEAWRPCITLCIPQDGWVSFEYLAWYQDGMSLPPLVTTSIDPGVSQADAGVLGRPTTSVLFGDGEVSTDTFKGGRLQYGVWLDRAHTWGVGGEYFEFSSVSTGFSGTSEGNPILARPFFNTQTGLEDSELVAFPNVITGSVAASAKTELVGGGVNFRYLTCCNEGFSKWFFCGCPEPFCSRSESLFGYRYLQLDEGVTVTEDLTSALVAAPGGFLIQDSFQTRNQFNGFDFGWKYRRTRGYWTYDSMFRMGIGITRQTATLAGQTTVNDPSLDPATQTYQGGLLTQTSNIGSYSQDQFAVVPEFRFNLGYQATDHWRATVGYTFIYWSNVVRPGDHISRDLNTDFLPPAADPFTGSQRPAFAWNTTDYWVQGVSIGAEYRW